MISISDWPYICHVKHRNPHVFAIMELKEELLCFSCQGLMAKLPSSQRK